MIDAKRLIAAVGVALVTVFSTSAPSQADPPWKRYQDDDRGPPGHGRGRYRERDHRPDYKYHHGRYEKKYRDRHHRHRVRWEDRRGGPPPWAPAHGYRRKYGRSYHDDHRHYRSEGVIVEVAPVVTVETVDAAVILPAAGAGTCHREMVGSIIGGAAGALVGSNFGKGQGKTAATIGGALVGMLIGGNVGRQMDAVDQGCVGQVLEQAPTGKAVAWRNPDDGASYEVTPTRTYQTDEGRYCREYQTTVVIDGRTQKAYGQACRQPDGSWEKVSG